MVDWSLNDKVMSSFLLLSIWNARVHRSGKELWFSFHFLNPLKWIYGYATAGATHNMLLKHFRCHQAQHTGIGCIRNSVLDPVRILKVVSSMQYMKTKKIAVHNSYLEDILLWWKCQYLARNYLVSYCILWCNVMISRFLKFSISWRTAEVASTLNINVK